MGLTTKEIGSSSFNDMISSVDRRSEYVENRAGANVTLNNFLTPYTLDNKSSILNAPCGYSNGMYASLRPVQTIGPELVTNGGFDTDSDWNIVNNTGTASEIINGYARIKTDGAYTQIDQLSVTIAAKSYKLQYTISQSDGGSLGFIITGNQTASIPSTVGTHIYYFVAHSTSIVFKRFSGDLDVKIDNVSVKEVTDADFDFSRGSSATRVNEKGLIEDVQILSGELVQNGDFEEIGSEEIVNGDFATDSDWSKGTGWSISGGKAISDGTSGSSNLTQGGAVTPGKTYKITITVSDYVSGNVQVSAGAAPRGTMTANGTYTFYQYATPANGFYVIAQSNFVGSIDNVSVKEVGQNWTFGTGWSMGDGKAVCDGSQTGNSSIQQSGIAQVGNIYKITFDLVVSSGFINYVNLGGWIDGTNLTTSGTYTYYTDTTTATDNLGIAASADFTGSIDNVSIIEITDDTDIPRIDYTNGTGALLLEPQSTNLLTYSEDFSQWGTGIGSSIESNTQETLSPQGIYNATKITATTTTDPYIFKFVNVTAVTHTASVYVKGVGNSVGKQARFLFWYIGTATGSTTSIPFTLTSEWQRVDGSFTPTGAGTLAIRLDFPADTAEVGDAGYLYGFQCEPLSYATSYIPTNGSTVTRSADVANNSGNANLINSTEGVLYAEIAALANSGNKRRISLSDGTDSNGVILSLPEPDDRIKIIIRSGGAVQVNSQSTVVITATDFNKIAIKYKENDFALWVNGIEVFVDSSGLAPIGLNKLAFDFDGSNNFYGNVKALAVFKEVLTDAELAQITSATQQEVFYEMRDRMLQINADYYEFDDYTTRLKKLF